MPGQTFVDQTVQDWLQRILRRQADNMLSPHWLFPLTIQDVVEHQRRKAWVQANVTPFSRVPPSSVEQCVRHLLVLAPVAPEDPVNGVPISTVHVLASAIIASEMPYTQIFNQRAVAATATTGTAVWLYPSQAFPGVNQDRVAGEYSMRFVHFSSQLGLAGIFRTGIIMPTSAETLALDSENESQVGRKCPLGFFCRVSTECYHERSILDFLLACSEHPKNTTNVGVTGTVSGTHYKFNRGDIWKEQALAYSYPAVRSGSKDKRWCVRSDLAAIDGVFLVQDHSDNWGTKWLPQPLRPSVAIQS